MLPENGSNASSSYDFMRVLYEQFQVQCFWFITQELEKPTYHTLYFLQEIPLNCLRFPKPAGKQLQPVKQLL